VWMDASGNWYTHGREARTTRRSAVQSRWESQALLLRGGVSCGRAWAGYGETFLPRLRPHGRAIVATRQIISTQDSVQLEQILRTCDGDTRAAIVNGLRAALKWREMHGG
jgi:hypothetical protein